MTAGRTSSGWCFVFHSLLVINSFSRETAVPTDEEEEEKEEEEEEEEKEEEKEEGRGENKVKKTKERIF